MNISICCPSYKREKVKTLNIIPDLKIYIDEKEEKMYKKENPNGKFVICDKGIQGNVARVRNYILDKEFSGGADVVCIVDDDLNGLYRFDVDLKNKFGYIRKEITNIYEFIEKYSIICYELGYKLWGVNCNSDGMSYRHYSPFSLSSIILGPFCVHLKNDIRYDEKLPLKEDYDLAIQHLNKYRGILRLNFVHYICEQSTNAGGCASIRNLKKEKEQFELLQKKWGSDIVRIDKSNKGRSNKIKGLDYNPIIKVPIKGI